uniref:Orf101 n=1 Tax=Phytophthora sojae TaxID=67593 RepID=A4ZH97_PHYSO|nr:orf101 [Phytophthora sojae]ABG54066.1 orf101 [Phytophthora sojae]
MSNTITQAITEYTTISTNVTGMVLRPRTLFLREQFQNQLENQINNSTTNRLPYLNRIETVQSIDSGTIIELNNTTSSERRVELMENIINYQNSNENRALLI